MNVAALLTAVVEGAMSAEDAGPQIAQVISTAAFKEAKELEGMDSYEVTMRRMAGSLPERDLTDTFLEVEVAHMVETITAEQYVVIRAAVVGEGR